MQERTRNKEDAEVRHDDSRVVPAVSNHMIVHSIRSRLRADGGNDGGGLYRAAGCETDDRTGNTTWRRIIVI